MRIISIGSRIRLHCFIHRGRREGGKEGRREGGKEGRGEGGKGGRREEGRKKVNNLMTVAKKAENRESGCT